MLHEACKSSTLDDDDIMRKFRINGGISEPAAYAVCALQEYGFDPEESGQVFYSVFDFGGGPTEQANSLGAVVAEKIYIDRAALVNHFLIGVFPDWTQALGEVSHIDPRFARMGDAQSEPMFELLPPIGTEEFYERRAQINPKTAERKDPRGEFVPASIM